MKTEKDFLEQQYEDCQRNICFLKIDNRLLERGKLSVGESRLIEVENGITANKNKIDFLEKRAEVVSDTYKEQFKTELK